MTIDIEGYHVWRMSSQFFFDKTQDDHIIEGMKKNA